MPTAKHRQPLSLHCQFLIDAIIILLIPLHCEYKVQSCIFKGGKEKEAGLRWLVMYYYRL